MIKHTQTILRQIADELFKCFEPFCGVCAKRVKKLITNKPAWFPEAATVNVL